MLRDVDEGKIRTVAERAETLEDELKRSQCEHREQLFVVRGDLEYELEQVETEQKISIETCV